MKKKIYTAIGLMSGTSLDGIDAALIRTDGYDLVEPGDFITLPYPERIRKDLKSCLGRKSDESGEIVHIENEMTALHAKAVAMLLEKAGLQPPAIDIIGFHGQTIFHDPDDGFTWQIGDGAILSALTDIAVVNDFRSADVRAGGQGAPLLPLYHRALAQNAGLQKPVAILNIGGVANVTYLGEGEEILAFDTGPGNALINDWVQSHTRGNFDRDGAYAAKGMADDRFVETCLNDPYFKKTPPKSLDRDRWTIELLKGQTLENGCAALTTFTSASVQKSIDHLPQAPQAWYVTGGGRHNVFLMQMLGRKLQKPVRPVEALGWNGDALEAQGFAYLAVRSLLGEPLSLPSTTGVEKPLTGGVLHPI